MQNGYALPSADGLNEVSEYLSSCDEAQRDALRGNLRIGIQWNTEVTLEGASHQVTQAYCSAVPVTYSQLSSDLWEPFAQLVLEASYEATFCAAALNSVATGSKKVFLTLLGGGAFGNGERWIISAIGRALRLFADTDLDITIVSYRRSNPHVKALVEALGSG